jgi:hypothetical protein
MPEEPQKTDPLQAPWGVRGKRIGKRTWQFLGRSHCSDRLAEIDGEEHQTDALARACEASTRAAGPGSCTARPRTRLILRPSVPGRGTPSRPAGASRVLRRPYCVSLFPGRC